MEKHLIGDIDHTVIGHTSRGIGVPAAGIHHAIGVERCDVGAVGAIDDVDRACQETAPPARMSVHEDQVAAHGIVSHATLVAAGVQGRVGVRGPRLDSAIARGAKGG